MKLESDKLGMEIHILEQFLKRYRTKQKRYDELSTKKNINDPISTYVMFKQINTYWTKIRPEIYNPLRNKQLDNIISLLEEFPEQTQMQGAFDGLLLLHETYNLNLTDLSIGHINVPGPTWHRKKNKIESAFEWSAQDLEFTGKLAYNRQFYDRAYEFTKAAENKAKQDESKDRNGIRSSNEIRKTLSIIKRDHDITLIKKGDRGNDWRTYRLPFDKTLTRKRRFKNVRDRKHHWKPVILNKIDPHVFINMSHPGQKRMLTEQFNMLCRGEQLRSFKNQQDLQSFYLHHTQAYLKLGPFKLEMKNKLPQLVIFHDFFDQKEVSAFIQHAQPNLKRSTRTWHGEYSQTSRTRTSKQVWAGEDERNLPEASVVSNRIALATLLNTTLMYLNGGGEDFQVCDCQIFLYTSIIRKKGVSNIYTALYTI